MTEPEPGSESGTSGDAEANVESESDTGSKNGSERDRRGGPPEITIESPPVEATRRLAGWWVALVEEQRDHRSYLLGESNRTLIREAMARHIVTDGLLVARLVSTADPETRDENRTIGGDDPLVAATKSRGDPTGRGQRRRWNRSRDRDRRRSPGTGALYERPFGDADAAGPTDIVGFVMYGPETGSYEQSVDRGIIENVYVHPDYRNRGIGAALLDRAERALAESGVDVIALEAMADNEAAQRLYARRGYRPHRIELEAPVERLESDDSEDRSDSSDDDLREGDETGSDPKR